MLRSSAVHVGLGFSPAFEDTRDVQSMAAKLRPGGFGETDNGLNILFIYL